jgi:hypothetical protein
LGGYAGVAEVYLGLWAKPPADGNGRQLKTKARRACNTLKKFARVFPIGEPQAWLWLGWFHQLSGHSFMAQRAWGRSLAAAERLGMPYDQGQAHYALGHCLPAENPARSWHAGQAADIFTRLEATVEPDHSPGRAAAAV